MQKRLIQPILFIVGLIVVLTGLYGLNQYRLQKSREGVSSAPVLYDAGLTKEDIKSIDNPTFTDVATADVLLGDDLLGIDVQYASLEHRFYPVQIMNWHQIVNDEIEGKPIVVTFDPLTFSAAVYDRGNLMFDVSGKVYNNNTVLQDRASGTMYVQMSGQSITEDNASRGMLGDKHLDRINSTLMTWGAWKEAYPEGEVLEAPADGARDYTRHPYGSYDTANTLYFPYSPLDERIAKKWSLVGVANGGESAAFVHRIVQGKGVLTADLGESQYVAFYDFDHDLTRVFLNVKPGVPGDRFKTYQYDFDLHEIIDVETGSVWSPEGYAISGPLKGEKLNQVPTITGFWFAFSSIFPNPKIPGLE